MELRREEIPSGPVIAGFSGGGFRVGERVYAQGLLLDPQGVAEWAAPTEVTLIDVAMLGEILAAESPLEFLLLGTGPRLVQPPRVFVRSLEARGIGVEAMDSRAAARAWGVLRQEGRRIVAALMPL